MDKQQLKPCPFCGTPPVTSHRAEHVLLGAGFVAFVACYCGGYSANAHRHASGKTVAEAIDRVTELWNRRVPQPPSASDTDVADVAAALEQQRALVIVAAVRQQGFAKSNTPLPTAAESAFDLACEEIEHRLRTEKWELGGVAMPSASDEREIVQCNCPGGTKSAALHAPNCPVRLRDAVLIDPYDGGTWLATSPGVDAAEQHPVAYRYCVAGGDWEYSDEPFFDGGAPGKNEQHQPLYAAPWPAASADEWVAEAEKLLDAAVENARHEGLAADRSNREECEHDDKETAEARAALLAPLKARP